jgi:CheY-like chemotaxis protein
MTERQVAHMSRLLEDLLDVSRISRGKILLRSQRCDLTAIVRDTTADYRPTLEDAGLRLTVRLPDRPLWVTGDGTRLAQVIGNVLHNAGKFTDRGGEVELTLAADENGRSAVIAVRDTGVGMDAETLARVFQPFSQAAQSLDRTRGGLGLGLSLVRGLVDSHAGKVSAHSDGPGRGSTITIRLPLDADQSSAPDGAADAPDSSAGPRRVLVIEDSPDGAQSLRLLLRMNGHDVAVAATGPEGLTKAREFRPDVVICDIGLPGMDGYAVARELRQSSPPASARLIALSGYGHREAQDRSREAGFDLHLTKPVDPDELLRVLRTGY